jgi:hypothetical protein
MLRVSHSSAAVAEVVVPEVFAEQFRRDWFFATRAETLALWW